MFLMYLQNIILFKKNVLLCWYSISNIIFLKNLNIKAIEIMKNTELLSFIKKNNIKKYKEIILK